jgi:hypothetical protein
MQQMKLKVLVVALAVAGMAATTLAANRASNPGLSAFKAQSRALRQEAQQAKVEAAAAVGSEVGDAASFGRNARYIGLMSSGTIYLTEFAEECVDDPEFPFGPDDHCVVLNPQPTVTNFDFPDVARMVIPAKASNSLFCHWQTPIASTFLANGTGAQFNARIVYNPYYSFENPVLADPALINPVTGLPFGGKIDTSLPGIRHQLTLQPNESYLGRDDETRACIAGMISKLQLMQTYGLTEAKANEFFKKDTIVTMGISGQAQGVISSSIINNVRWLGD